MGRPAGDSIKLEQRRRVAIELVEKDGLSQSEAARQLRVNPRTVRKWVQWHRGRGERGVGARKTPGRPSRLGQQDCKRLEKILIAGAQASGFSNDLWTCPRVAQVIRRKFEITYHVDHVLRLLRRLGWSPQRPESKALERDEAKIRGWVRRSWPRIKKKPKKLAQL